MKFPKIFQSKSKLRVIELEGEVEDLKDALISRLKIEVIRLEEQIAANTKLVKLDSDIPKPFPHPKPRIRTMSEVATILENKSRDKYEIFKAEEAK